MQRALEAWPRIDLTDDRDGCLFVATVHRDAHATAPQAGAHRPEDER